MKFYTVHRPKKHSAHSLEGGVLVLPQETEIDLVRELKKRGIDLQKYRYFNNRGDEKFMAINWELQTTEEANGKDY